MSEFGIIDGIIHKKTGVKEEDKKHV